MGGPEQKSGKPNGIDRKPWKISLKTPNSVLKDSHTVNLYSAMTVDVNNNARELIPTVDWNEVIWARACDDRGNAYTINSMTEDKFVRRLRPVAEQMEWGMSAPEVVYIGGLHFVHAIGRINADRERGLEELNDPKRRFVPEIRQAKIEKTQDEIKRFESYKAAIEDAIRRYARRKLTPGWTNYVKELQKLFNALISGKEEETDETVKALLTYSPRKPITEKQVKTIEKRETILPSIPQEGAIDIFQGKIQLQTQPS